MGHRVWVSVLLAATSVLVASGAQAAGEPAAATRASSAPVGAGERAADASGDKQSRGKKKKRPGCGRFCTQAGGFGAGPDPEFQPVDVPEQTIDAPRKRIVGIIATCNLDETCVGAIILDSLKIEYGRANLRIAPHTTETVLVGLSRKANKYLKDHGDRKVFATVPLVGNDVVSFSDKLTLLAPG